MHRTWLPRNLSCSVSRPTSRPVLIRRKAGSATRSSSAFTSPCRCRFLRGNHPVGSRDWTISDDGLTYTFKLREGLMWSDGQPVTAEDYRQSFLRQLNPRNRCLFAQEFFPFETARLTIRRDCRPRTGWPLLRTS
ncbi:MAG: hypothetical protein IPK19_10435 [Chloroflexi bacterium]|nr:hypothetical protein [Chloroflexota bacterium]